MNEVWLRSSKYQKTFATEAHGNTRKKENTFLIPWGFIPHPLGRKKGKDTAY
jgi:hypothetical protein